MARSMFDGRVITLLLIEDEDFDVRRIQNTLRPFEGQIRIRDIVSNGSVALDLLRAAPEAYDVVVMDFQIAGGLRGENLIHEIKQINPSVQIIVVTKMTVHFTDFDFANSLIRAGAYWYCTKYPGDIEDQIYQPTDFVLSIFNAYQKRQLEKEHLRSSRKLSGNVEKTLRQKQLIGVSQALEHVREQIKKCAETGANVLITGPSGTGKELVAANIHYTGPRKFENFVPINCGGIPNDLIESELFGYEKGSFTGAESRKTGLFEAAHEGTLFLDEVGELPASAQVKLLRVLEDGQIEKIGRTEKIAVDVRVIAATNKDLAREVTQKRFRDDLFYRLNVVHLSIPALTDRPEDIPVLLDHFIVQFSYELGRPRPSIDKDALTFLSRYGWPGNVRELKNFVQRLFFVGEHDFGPSDVRLLLGVSPDEDQDPISRMVRSWQQEEIIPWKEVEKNVRAKYFAFVRKHSKSDAEAAKKLGLAPPNFYRMCKELGLK